MSNQHSAGWTEERVQQLRKLHEEGLSCSLIGIELGLTRNAVIGKLARLGLKSAPKVVRDNRQRGATRKADPTRFRSRPRTDAELPRLAVADVVPLHLSLDDLRPTTCRYPYGDRAYTYCGHPTAGAGMSYCAPHHHLCYGGTLKTSLQVVQDKRAYRAKLIAVAA